MRTIAASLAGVLAIGLMPGCDGMGSGVLNPTPIDTASNASILGFDTSFVTVRSVGDPVCPTRPPLVGSIGMHVAADGVLDVSLAQVQMTFTDTAGLPAPAVTLPAPALVAQFGSTLIPAGSRRAFPLSFPFGCDTGRAGTLVIAVVVTDENGRDRTAEARVAVR